MIWETDGLPRQLLEDVLEPEMAKQYRIRRGQQCKFMPVFAGDRWLCSCGRENTGAGRCDCGLEPEPLTRQVLEELSRDAAARLEQEELTRDQREAEAQRAEKAKHRRKILRRVLVAVACVAAVVLLAVGGVAFVRYGLPAIRYRQARNALEEGAYTKAYRLFVLANGHEDSEAYLARFYSAVLTQTGTTVYTEEAKLQDPQLPDTLHSKVSYTYDSDGHLLTIQTEDRQSDWQEAEVHTYTSSYDENGNALVRENSYGKTVRSYNDHGSIAKEEHYRADGTHDYSKIFVYAYDEQGRVVSSSEICSDHVLVNYSYEQQLTFTYDDRGNLVEQTCVTNFPATSESNYEVITRWTYNERNDPVFMESDMICPDDPVDNCLEETTWVYDAEGRLLSQDALQEYPNNPLATFRTVHTCTYDGDGNVLSDTTVGTFPNDPDRNYEETKVCTYDREGRLTEQRAGVRYAGEERDLFSGFSSVETYTYDFLGRLKEKVLVKEYTNADLSYTQSYAYTYGLGGGLYKAKEVYHSHREDTKANYEAIIRYDENGLPQKVETVSETLRNTREYTYGFYYYPEGEEMPQNDAGTPEIIYSFPELIS